MFFALFLLFSGAEPGTPADADADGFPDAAELRTTEDRQNFRRWFTTIALSRYLNPTKDIVDCADLVRYSYREALKMHDSKWREGFGDLLDKNIPELEAFHYPEVPFLETDIFRLTAGSYYSSDLTEHRFGNFADVPHLRRFNTVEVSRRLGGGVESGDLLFFAPKGREAHVMIYIELKGDRYLLYHTGPGKKDKGEMRLVRFETLMALDDETWRPDEKNPAFVGFSRFKILE